MLRFQWKLTGPAGNCLVRQEMITITINGEKVDVPNGTTLAAAILSSGEDSFRRSVSGDDRGPLCGMGICFECRVTINGRLHQRSCIILAEDGMEVVTGE